MKVRNIGFFMLLIVLGCWIVIVQAETFPPGLIESTSIILPGQAPEPEDDTSVDVFFPDVDAQFPIAIVLQGGLVAGGSYSQFGAELARFGFVVASQWPMVWRVGYSDP